MQRPGFWKRCCCYPNDREMRRWAAMLGLISVLKLLPFSRFDKKLLSSKSPFPKKYYLCHEDEGIDGTPAPEPAQV